MRRLLPLLLTVPLLALVCDDVVEPPAPALTTISVAPALDTIETIGATQTLTATTLDQDGEPFSGATLSWSSSATSVATVNDAGSVTAVANGTSTITAASGTVQGSATLVVHQKATALVVATQPGGGPAGAAFPTQPVVQLRDAGGTTVTHDNASTVTASLTGATLTGTTTVTAVGGVATFTNLGVTEAGTHALRFSSEGLTPVDAEPVSVTNDAELLLSAEPTEEDIGHAAFDGVNFVIAFKTGSSNGHTVRRVSPLGALVGGPLPVPGAQGDPLKVACDGTRCLITWAHNDQMGGWWVNGQFLKADGTLDGTSFVIVPAISNGNVIGAPNIVFGGGTYMLEYVVGPSHDDPGLARYVRTISTSGVVGPEVPVASATSEGFASLAYGGGVFLTAYLKSDNTAAARTITPAGVVGSEVALETSVVVSNLPVAFDGTNFIVLYSLAGVGADGDDVWVVGKRVSPAGTLVGSEFVVDNVDGEPTVMALGAVAIGGGRVLASLLQSSPSTSDVVITRRIITAGAQPPTAGSATVLAAKSSGKVPLGGVFASGGNAMLLVLLRGTPGPDPLAPLDDWTNVDLYARVLPIP